MGFSRFLGAWLRALCRPLVGQVSGDQIYFGSLVLSACLRVPSFAPWWGMSQETTFLGRLVLLSLVRACARPLSPLSGACLGMSAFCWISVLGACLRASSLGPWWGMSRDFSNFAESLSWVRAGAYPWSSLGGACVGFPAVGLVTHTPISTGGSVPQGSRGRRRRKRGWCSSGGLLSVGFEGGRRGWDSVSGGRKGGDPELLWVVLP